MEPICEIQGIFKWENGDYEVLDEVSFDFIRRNLKIFFALNFPKVPDMKHIIIDITFDGNKRSKYLIRDPQKLHAGVVEELGTDINTECVWLGYVEIPPYDKYFSVGKHSIKIQVAPFVDENTRDFSPENGGVTGEFEYVITPSKPEIP